MSPFKADNHNTLATRSNTVCSAECLILKDCVVGSIGLEPILYATKKRCITIMLRPNVGAIYAEIAKPASQKIQFPLVLFPTSP